MRKLISIALLVCAINLTVLADGEIPQPPVACPTGKTCQQPDEATASDESPEWALMLTVFDIFNF